MGAVGVDAATVTPDEIIMEAVSERTITHGNTSARRRLEFFFMRMNLRSRRARYPSVTASGAQGTPVPWKSGVSRGVQGDGNGLTAKAACGDDQTWAAAVSEVGSVTWNGVFDIKKLSMMSASSPEQE